MISVVRFCLCHTNNFHSLSQETELIVIDSSFTTDEITIPNYPHVSVCHNLHMQINHLDYTHILWVEHSIKHALLILMS